MEKNDKQYEKMRAVNKKFYDLPPKDREIIEQSLSGASFDMVNTDKEKKSGRFE